MTLHRVAATVLLAVCCTAATDIGAWHKHIRETYSGERAKDMVVWLDQHWRLTGNEAFDASIHYVAQALEAAGYVPEGQAEPDAALTYRLERRPMERHAWEPVDGALDIVLQTGTEEVLRFATNRSMIAINSYSTPSEGVEAEVVHVGNADDEHFRGIDVRDKIVLGETRVSRLFRAAVQDRGALGVLSYDPWDLNRPEENRHSIQFTSIPHDSVARSWGVLLSSASHRQLSRALDRGAVRVRVTVDTRFTQGDELTLVANVRGNTEPNERFVFSAHLDEPGANDNASGVAALAEGARVLAELVLSGRIAPARTITMLWGSEIRSTGRYLSEDSIRAGGVRWGVSLDMVGEDTKQTGGTFLIEKMPDPSAVWTRGTHKHSEWGDRPLSVEDLTPHYLNDFVLERCNEEAVGTDWVVNTNPYEGGSDHVPFLRAGKPGLLLWHFTDVFYHTDGDRPDKVSPETLAHVGTCALLSAVTLTSADGATARLVVAELLHAALSRLEAEYELSRVELEGGTEPAEQTRIVRTWMEWYVDAIKSATDIEVGGSSVDTRSVIEAAVLEVSHAGEAYLNRLLAEGGQR
jgi:hypothetical protein